MKSKGEIELKNSKQKMIKQITEWAAGDGRIKGLLLVGSYARDTAKPDSDIDLVVMTNDKNALLQLDWIDVCGLSLSYVREEYGACTSIRVFYQDAEIEYGLVDMTWIVSPLDAGTRHVLEDGYKVLFASHGIDDVTIEMLLEKGTL